MAPSLKWATALALAALPAADASSVSGSTGSGGLQTSADGAYTTTSSISPTPATSSAPGTLNYSGYQGQLFDPVSILASATPGEIPEDTTSQLSATVLLDDSTRLALPFDEFTWSILSGPIASISPVGLLTASTVRRDTPASASAAIFGLSSSIPVTVLNTDPDNLGIYAGDGLDDDWQVEFFGEGNPLALAHIDADKDGFINEFENLARLDPTDPTSRFEVTLDFDPLDPDNRRVTFSPRWENRFYELWHTPSLDQPFARIDGARLDPTTDGGPASLLDRFAGPLGFYQVLIRDTPLDP